MDRKKESYNFQKNGIPKRYIASKERMKCPQSEYGDDYGDAQAVANAVHHYIDWLRATQKRTWDNRPMPNALKILLLCQKGMYINNSTLLHYHEDPKRH